LSTSIIPAIAELQRLAGPMKCCFCLKELKRKRGQGRPPFVCFSADCRTQEDTVRKQHRAALRRNALASLGRVVRSLGWSTETLAVLIGEHRAAATLVRES